MLAGIFGIPSVTRLSFGVMEASWAESTSDTAAATNSASASRGPIDLISKLLCRILTGISIAQALSVQTHVNLPKVMNARPAKRSIASSSEAQLPAKLEQAPRQKRRRLQPAWPVVGVDRQHVAGVQGIVDVEIQLDSSPG